MDSFSDQSFRHQPVSVIVFMSSECQPLSVSMLCLSITSPPAKKIMGIMAVSLVSLQTMSASVPLGILLCTKN